MKSLNGAELADYIKENQAHKVRSLRSQKTVPKLAIIRNSNNPVITKYVRLKQHYGEDIGVEVIDMYTQDLTSTVKQANTDSTIHGIIVQLPLKNIKDTTELLNLINPSKDVDGLGKNANFDSATATAINWLMAGYNIDLAKYHIALVGHGKLVGGPLEKMWHNSGYDVTVFDDKSDLSELKHYDLIVTATGVPHLIKTEMIKPGAIVVDSGTASENGVLTGDISEEVRRREDLEAITPKIGGVGPLTVATLFDHVITAAEKLA